MSNSTELPQLPNPFTYLAWLPPDVADQVVTSHYVTYGALGAWLWDVLMSLPDEFDIFCKYGVRFPDIVYILSRLATGWFIVTTTVPSGLPTGHCHAVVKLSAWAPAIQFPVNTLLFFFRIRAVFFGKRLVIGFFALMWLAILALSFLAPFSLDGVPLGDSKYCTTTRVKDDVSTGIVLTAVNDTLVFLAITVQLLVINHRSWGSRTAWIRVFFTGEGMGRISLILLQTGQLYYLVTVGFTITTAVLILTPSVPTSYSNIMIPVSACITNMMTTRVYRQLKQGLLYDTTSTVDTGHHTMTRTIEFAQWNNYSRDATGTKPAAAEGSLASLANSHTPSEGQADASSIA